jgi:hypothetical protein
LVGDLADDFDPFFFDGVVGEEVGVVGEEVSAVAFEGVEDRSSLVDMIAG